MMWAFFPFSSGNLEPHICPYFLVWAPDHLSRGHSVASCVTSVNWVFAIKTDSEQVYSLSQSPFSYLESGDRNV